MGVAEGSVVIESSCEWPALGDAQLMHSHHAEPRSLTQGYQIVRRRHVALSSEPVIAEYPSALKGHLRSWWYQHISPVITEDYQSHLVSWGLPANRSTHMLSQSRLLQRWSPSHRLIRPDGRAPSCYAPYKRKRSSQVFDVKNITQVIFSDSAAGC